jgi:DNA-binding beta-propeller fold protein YncE
VSLQARTNDEVWVVNEVSDSLSIVSLSLGATVATLSVPDEPADIVFAQNKAFVSCGRNNVVRVFDALTRQEITSISLEGLNPRALATSADGTTILAAFQLSGNSTTTLPPAVAPDPPAPTNPALPAAPKTGLIVEASDPRVPYTVLDRDVVEIDATTHRIKRYHGGTGTNLFDLAVQPGTSDIWVANTDARNLVRFEPQLRGQFVFNRVTRVASATGNISLHDLNPGIDYGQLPNPSALAASLAQPTSIVFSQDGARLWVAAFGSDRVAELSGADGSIVRRIDVRPSMADSRQMRGPVAWSCTRPGTGCM